MVDGDDRVQKVKLVSGMRKINYFVEFPIIAKRFDAFSLLQKVKAKMESGKGGKFNVRVTRTDSYL